MSALVIVRWNKTLLCLTMSSMFFACGCKQTEIETQQVSPTYLAKADSVSVWFGTFEADDSGHEVSEEDYDPRRILAWLKKSQWTDDADQEWQPRWIDEIWRIDVHEDGELIGRLGVMPRRVGHRFYDIDTHRYFENQEWEGFITTLLKRNPSQWKERLDSEYLLIGYGPVRK